MNLPSPTPTDKALCHTLSGTHQEIDKTWLGGTALKHFALLLKIPLPFPTKLFAPTFLANLMGFGIHRNSAKGAS